VRNKIKMWCNITQQRITNSCTPRHNKPTQVKAEKPSEGKDNSKAAQDKAYKETLMQARSKSYCLYQASITSL
jgi:hypothetical protein